MDGGATDAPTPPSAWAPSPPMQPSRRDSSAARESMRADASIHADAHATTDADADAADDATRSWAPAPATAPATVPHATRTKELSAAPSALPLPHPPKAWPPPPSGSKPTEPGPLRGPERCAVCAAEGAPERRSGHASEQAAAERHAACGGGALPEALAAVVEGDEGDGADVREEASDAVVAAGKTQAEAEAEAAMVGAGGWAAMYKGEAGGDHFDGVRGAVGGALVARLSAALPPRTVEGAELIDALADLGSGLHRMAGAQQHELLLAVSRCLSQVLRAADSTLPQYSLFLEPGAAGNDAHGGEDGTPAAAALPPPVPRSVMPSSSAVALRLTRALDGLLRRATDGESVTDEATLAWLAQQLEEWPRPADPPLAAAPLTAAPLAAPAASGPPAPRSSGPATAGLAAVGPPGAAPSAAPPSPYPVAWQWVENVYASPPSASGGCGHGHTSGAQAAHGWAERDLASCAAAGRSPSCAAFLANDMLQHRLDGVSSSLGTEAEDLADDLAFSLTRHRGHAQPPFAPDGLVRRRRRGGLLHRLSPRVASYLLPLMVMCSSALTAWILTSATGAASGVAKAPGAGGATGLGGKIARRSDGAGKALGWSAMVS